MIDHGIYCRNKLICQTAKHKTEKGKILRDIELPKTMGDLIKKTQSELSLKELA